jgi:hypothetical protein
MADRDELNQLWCGQTTGPPTKGEDMLTIAIERAERFDRTIRLRNWRECGAGVLVAAIFAFIALESPNALAVAGNLLVAASGLWIVFYLLRYGRGAPLPAPDRSLADFQQALLQQYDQQIRLLLRVKYWYLLPPYVGLLLASAGTVMANAAKGQPAWPQSIAVVIYTSVFAVVWWLNGTYAADKLRAKRARLVEEMNPSRGERE